jgi:hypothetical protein
MRFGQNKQRNEEWDAEGNGPIRMVPDDSHSDSPVRSVQPEMIVALIDTDWLYEEGDSIPSRVGTAFEEKELLRLCPGEKIEYGDKIRFKLYDDDKIPYYAGWLLDDAQCWIQEMVLNWGSYDSGCTSILVHKSGRWIQEIS